MQKLLKFLGALAGLLVLLVIALVAFVMLTLKPNLPGSEFALQPVPADGGRNVLVLGATGKLGTEIVRDLREHGDQVTAFVRASSDRSELEPGAVKNIAPEDRGGGAFPGQRP
jgi:NADPH:quinone reductase-like Zn-dependent oxidoreductase